MFKICTRDKQIKSTLPQGKKQKMGVFNIKAWHTNITEAGLHATWLSWNSSGMACHYQEGTLKVALSNF